MSDKFEVNKEYIDEFGRVSGIFLVDKPVGVKSHDLVYDFRRKYNTQKVGHAGALDPFASGMMIILVGKAVELSDSFLGLDKTYTATVLLGVKTNSQDPEGEIEEVANTMPQNPDYISEVLKSFEPEYSQTVPVFSSVKVNGQKLRKLAHSSDNIVLNTEEGKPTASFYKNNNLTQKLVLPVKKVKINSIKVLSLEPISASELVNLDFKKKLENTSFGDLEKLEFSLLKIEVDCGKGTYIRKLAEDIGLKLNLPSMLLELRRIKINGYSLKT